MVYDDGIDRVGITVRGDVVSLSLPGTSELSVPTHILSKSTVLVEAIAAAQEAGMDCVCMPQGVLRGGYSLSKPSTVYQSLERACQISISEN
jgi:hypothetical protein